MTDPAHQWPHQDTAALNAFYGDPRGNNGMANPQWEAENLVHWVPPYEMYYSGNPGVPMSHLLVHKKCLDTFNAAFKEVLDTLGMDYIKANRLNITGGTNCYRLERGGSNLSVHSWGCAIDMDPQHNPFPHVWDMKMISLKFAGILQKHGFTWRGAGGDIDPMHFQLCYRK